MACEEALRNPLVLHHIFELFSTKYLLSSCSLVNRTWNRVARKVIRDHRKCQAVLPQDKYPRICPLLQGLDKLYAEVPEDNRVVIPMNSLRISVSRSARDSKSDEEMPKKLPKGMKLRYLEIRFYSRGKVDSCVHRPVDILLQHNAENLRGLTIEINAEYLQQVFADCNNHFPSLEEITFILKPSYSHQDLSAEKKVVERIFDGAKNLKRIYPMGKPELEIIPEEKYYLLAQVELNFSETQDLTFLQKVAENCVNLKELSICTPGKTLDCSGKIYSQLRNKFDIVLQRLLQTCHQSLKSISVGGSYALPWFSFPAFTNVSKLAMSLDRYKKTPAENWYMISSIDYNSQMPSLKDVKISYNCGIGLPEWPEENDDQHAIFSDGALKVRKLRLELQVRKIKLAQIKQVFPRVLELELTLSQTQLDGEDILPLSDIWEQWPNLEELKITGERKGTPSNYDACFLGINEEEVELLRQTYDEGHLRDLNIVPIRPSLLAMPNLRKLLVDIYFAVEKGELDSDHPPIVTSKSTELIAFKHRDFSVSWEVGELMGSDEESLYDEDVFERVRDDMMWEAMFEEGYDEDTSDEEVSDEDE